MTVHLLKMAAGIKSIEQLRNRQNGVRKSQRDNETVVIHSTRNFPRRWEEILEGGSLYWIIKRYVLVRNRIVNLEREKDDDGRPVCHIHLAPELIAVMPVRKRPIQGWRYLEAGDAPADLAGIGVSESDEPMPPEMAADLRALGLI